jgi:hypothetical protein
MSAIPLTKPENISNLLNVDQEYAAPAIVANNVLHKDWNAEREHSLRDPEAFWADYAARFARMAFTTSGSPAPRLTSPSTLSTVTPTQTAAIAPRSSGW